MKKRFSISVVLAVAAVSAVTLAVANFQHLLEWGFDAIIYETKIETKESIDHFSIGSSRSEVVDSMKTMGVHSLVIKDEEILNDEHLKYIRVSELDRNHWANSYDHWYFYYLLRAPHGEFYDLYYENDKLIKIRYRRQRFQWDL